MATTINSYSVGLGLDASNYIRNSSLSRKETASLKREINSARTPAENYERKVALLEKALEKGAIDQRTYNRLLDEAATKLRKASQAADKLQSSQKQLGGSASKVKTSLLGIAAAAAAIGRVGASAVKSAADMESLTLQFELQMGSAEKAAKVLNDLRDFTATTPFRLDEVAQTARGLLAAKTPAEDLQRELRILGNVAAVAGTPLFEMSQILIQARMTMQVSLGDLNRLGNRGIPVFSMLAEQLGVAEDQIRSMASTGKISTEDLFAVFEKLGGVNGKYADATAKLAETFNGSFSTMQDAVGMFLEGAGKPLIPLVKAMTAELTNAASAFDTFGFSAKRAGTDTAIGFVANLVDVVSELPEPTQDWLTEIFGYPTQAELDQRLADTNAAMEAHIAEQKKMRERGEALPGSLEEKKQIEQQKKFEEEERQRAKTQELAEKFAREQEARRADDYAAAAEANENRIDQLKKQHIQEQDRLATEKATKRHELLKRLERDVAAGPGSFSQGDDVAFLAKQENARIAKEAVLNLENDGGAQIETTIAQQEASERRLAEIEQLQREANEQRRISNELLKAANETKPQRVR